MTDTFAFTDEYQAKALGLMLHDTSFAIHMRSAVEPSHFGNKALQWFFNTLNTEDVFTPVTLKEELIKDVKAKKIREDEIQKYVETYQLITAEPLPAEKEHLRATLSSFVRTQSVKQEIMASFDLMDAGEWETIASRMADACRAGIDIEDNGQFFFKDIEARLQRRSLQEEYQRYSTGIPELDDLTYGGIKSKQLGMIVGGTGRGKSVFLSWLGRVAVLLGKRVLYVTLEMPEDDIAARYDAMLSRVKIGELKDHQQEILNTLKPMAQRYADSLIIKEWPAMQMTVWMLKSYVMKLSSMGMPPDMVIVDYVDLIKPHTNYGSVHEDVDAITKALHGITKELNIATWTASQLNRSGLAMETPDETSISGALSKLFTCDLSIFMAQTNEEREDEEMRLVIGKNRNGPAGRTVRIDTNYAYMTFYRASIKLETNQDDGQTEADDEGAV